MTDTVAQAVEEVLPPDDEVVYGVATATAPFQVQARGGLFNPGVLSSYSPVVGDRVALLRQDATWLALGATRGPGTPGGPARLVRYGVRFTPTTASAAEQGVLRIDDIALAQGNRYAAQVISVNMVVSVGNDRGNLNLRVSQSGVATTASTLIQVANSPQIQAVAAGIGLSIGGTFVATASSIDASVLLTHARISGAGNISLQGGTQFPIELLIYDLGPDLGNTGVSL